MRLVVVTAALLLVLPGAAQASERHEARLYAAAMRPLIAGSPAAVVQANAGIAARSGQVQATCMDAVRAGAADEGRTIDLTLSYLLYVGQPVAAALLPLERAADLRLAAIPTSSRLLRRARSARHRATREVRAFYAIAPDDYCAGVTAWQANGWRGDLVDYDAYGGPFAKPGDAALLTRAGKLLRHHGATRREVAAFKLEDDFPGLNTLEDDPVIAALTPQPRSASIWSLSSAR